MFLIFFIYGFHFKNFSQICVEILKQPILFWNIRTWCDINIFEKKIISYFCITQYDFMKKIAEKDFGFELRKLRESKGISQVELAVDLNITQSKISKIENGTEQITLSYFIKILNYFSLSSHEIIELLEEKKKIKTLD